MVATKVLGVHFTLFENQVILKENLPLFKILDARYAEPIYKSLIETTRLHGSAKAIQAIGRLETTMPGRIRRMNDLDALEFSVQQNTKERAEKMGAKVLCQTCKRKYYDLNRNVPCPLCSTDSPTPPKLTAIPSAK